MAYNPDKAGIFESDTHRRVLAHLSLPTDAYGWSVKALFDRIKPDVGTAFEDVKDEATGLITTGEQELEKVLKELEASGFAAQFGEAWRQTEEGFKRLTGPIANEPGPVAEATAPAIVSPVVPIEGEGTSPNPPENAVEQPATETQTIAPSDVAAVPAEVTNAA